MDGGTTNEPAGNDLSTVLRRLALEPQFAAEVLSDPLRALGPYRLTSADLAALAIWLERRVPGAGMVDLFDPGRDPGDEAGDDPG